MTEEQIRELAAELHEEAAILSKNLYYRALPSKLIIAAEVIKVLAAPVDKAEIQAMCALTNVSLEDYLEAARQARLARIQ